jgi:FdrA protein
MAAGFRIRKREYYDSVFLMGVNKRLSEAPGVQQAAVLMGTEANKRLLAGIGITGAELDDAAPSDLIVAVIAETEDALQEAIGSLDRVLKTMTEGRRRSGVRTLSVALERMPTANLVVLSIPGEYAADEARKALEDGLNVFIFSSNVPLDQELELKRLGRSKGLLVMGPDCGTSIINGVGIGFANRVRRGSIGVIGSSGTGLQEYTSQVHNAGGGISHAVGTGSNDLSDVIGGVTTLAALRQLEADPATRVIAIVAKPPGKATLKVLLETAESLTKPLIGCFIGVEDNLRSAPSLLQQARTIDDAVDLSLHAAGMKVSTQAEAGEDSTLVNSIRTSWKPGSRFLRGVFAGGTFCFQSQQILREAGLVTYSNSPLEARYELVDPDRSMKHTVVDIGDEHYTLGKPHPMIDSTIRARRIVAEAADSSTAILLLDFILGYNAANDPVGDLLDALTEAQAMRRKVGNPLTIVASVCGTDEDRQDRALQVKMLREIGVHVFDSNARATDFCARLLKG